MIYGYTLLAVVGVVATLGLERLLRTGLLRDRRYWITIAIIAFFQFLVDGWLTCRPIVLYAEDQFSSLRLGCPDSVLFDGGGMPVEDLAFGWAMITQTLQWWVWWGRRGVDSGREVPSGSDEQIRAEGGGASRAGGPGGDP